ncbi:MAG: hypothetical protein LC800_16820 [Acidobacteria bacterium]|nr:hypothetical protein [Acidobacteriota bacterium]
MNSKPFKIFRKLGGACALAAALTVFSVPARAAAWGGIEPLKSRRADVQRLLGKPLEEKPGQTGTLRFKVAGGSATVVFIDARFVSAHKLDPALEGTVRQIALQHENSSDTPESLKLTSDGAFVRESRGNVTTFRNQRDGVHYTFIDGRLRTTNYTAASALLARAQVKG